jgi:hypothetical protein
MMKFGNFISESLAAEIKSEPKTNASREARRLGLTYMGFGRYADSKGKIAYTVDNNRLVPYKHIEEIQSMHDKARSTSNPNKSKELMAQVDTHSKVLSKREAEDNKILSKKSKEIMALNKELYKFYKPGMYDDEEIRAIEEYTNDAFGPINRFLYKGHDPDTEPEDASFIESMVEALDSAFEETQAPFAYTVYTGLSERYKAEKIKPGGEYIFRGYLSTSIDFNTAIGGFTDSDWGNKKPVVLQIDISKGQKSIYVDPLSSNTGELETMLPRGSRVKIISGPHQIDYGILNPEADPVTINLFHCVLVEDL